jgi:hypothetical protein
VEPDRGGGNFGDGHGYGFGVKGRGGCHRREPVLGQGVGNRGVGGVIARPEMIESGWDWFSVGGTCEIVRWSEARAEIFVGTEAWEGKEWWGV